MFETMVIKNYRTFSIALVYFENLTFQRKNSIKYLIIVIFFRNFVSRIITFSFKDFSIFKFLKDEIYE